MKPRILFVYQLPSPFILQDRDLLSEFAAVHEFRWTGHRHPARALSKWMVQHRQSYDLVLAWFGDVHASTATRIARLLRKPSAIVVGGYDVNDAPGYGFLSTKEGMRRARGHFERADRILAVSTSLARELEGRFPAAKGKVHVLSTGVDVRRFRAGAKREPRVLSVAGAAEWKRAWVKGWDRVAAVARLMPATPFRLIGGEPEVAHRLDPPPNLEVKGRKPHVDLIAEYQKAAVYLQPSRTEGLPNTVMEAMACGCVPVVTPVGGMPELVGDTGVITGEDPRDLMIGVEQALRSPELGLAARARIMSHYSLEHRRRGLARTVEDLLASPP